MYGCHDLDALGQNCECGRDNPAFEIARDKTKRGVDYLVTGDLDAGMKKAAKIEKETPAATAIPGLPGLPQRR